MSEKSVPQISSAGKSNDYTRISFKPDLAKFGMTCIDDDLDALFQKRVYDLAGCLNDVKIFLNDKRIKIKGFKQYVDLYVNSVNEISGSAATKPIVLHEVVNPRWEIAFTLSDGQFQQVKLFKPFSFFCFCIEMSYPSSFSSSSFKMHLLNFHQFLNLISVANL